MKKMISIVLVLALTLSFAGISAFAAETVHEVATVADLNEAIGAAVSGDIINMAPGVYEITAAVRVDGKILTINGNGAVLDGSAMSGSNSSSRSGFTAASGANVTINDLTIQNTTAHGVNIIGSVTAPAQTRVALNNVTIKDCDKASVQCCGILIAVNLNTSGAGWGHAINAGDNYGNTVVNVASGVLAEDIAVKLDDAKSTDSGGTAAMDGNSISITLPNNSVIEIENPENAGSYLLSGSGAVVYYDAPAVEAGVPAAENPGQELSAVDANTPLLITAPDAVLPASSIRNTEIIANVSPSYIIVIPELVDFGTINRKMQVQSRDFFVRIENALLEYDSAVTVDVSSGFSMKNKLAPTHTLPYLLFNTAQGGTSLTTGARYCSFVMEGEGTLIGDDLTEQVDGRVTTDPASLTRAGAYSDTMIFVCEYVTA